MRLGMDFGPFLLFCLCFNTGWTFQLDLKCEPHIVLGANLHCTTRVFEDDHITPAKNSYRFMWEDNAIPQHNRKYEGETSLDTWSIEYNKTVYSVGQYIIRVSVCELWLEMCAFFPPKTSTGTFFEITEMLNGNLVLTQTNQTRDQFVSTIGPVKFSVALQESDKEFLHTAPTILSYWFVDCVYYGIATDLDFDYNFTKPEEEHVIETLVVGDFRPLPPPPTTTTTSPSTIKPTTPTATTPKTATTTATSTTTVKSVDTRPSGKVLMKREASPSGNRTNIKIWQNGTLVPYNGSFPYVCNSTVVVTDNNMVNGYFKVKVTSKDPVSNITVSGNNWLQHGDLLSLQVNCKGSQKMQFCYYFKSGLYNVTGNETCASYSDLDNCDFPIRRYFQDQHTVIIIIKNEINKQVTSVAVTVYKVKHQAQLSVIVVPVVFCLVAVVTVVFGVAYYLQNRSRFVVEVADFDFGPKYADMEYKTFKERLKDSVVNAFTKDASIASTSSSEAPLWPPGHKYGSMT